MEFYCLVCYNYIMTTALNILKKASPQETDYYFNHLYPLQDTVLEAIQGDAFYLTGGTALSRFYFQHRFSDDLDFFYDGFNHPKENFNFSYREIIYRLEKCLENIEITMDGEFFKRLFVKRDNIALKIEFVYENYRTVGEKKNYKGALIDSPENICANQIGAVSDRRAVKDFLALFFLLKQIDLNQAIRWSELKRVPPDYEGIMMATGDLLKNPYLLEGEVLILRDIDDKEFSSFIKKLVGDLIGNAKSGNVSV